MNRSFNSRLLNFEIQNSMALGAGFSAHSFYFYFKSTLLVISSSMMLICPLEQKNRSEEKMTGWIHVGSSVMIIVVMDKNDKRNKRADEKRL